MNRPEDLNARLAAADLIGYDVIEWRETGTDDEGTPTYDVTLRPHDPCGLRVTFDYEETT